MCRGCRIRKNEQATCDEYLGWLGQYQYIITIMKALEKKLIVYQGGVDSKEHVKLLDSHRKRLIKLRKEYAKTETLLADV